MPRRAQSKTGMEAHFVILLIRRSFKALRLGANGHWLDKTALPFEAHSGAIIRRGDAQRAELVTVRTFRRQLSDM